MEKNYLTNESYIKMGKDISSLVTDIKLIKSTIEFIPSLNNPDVKRSTCYYYQLVYDTINIIYDKMQDIEENIDLIGAILYSVDDLNSLNDFIASKENIQLQLIKVESDEELSQRDKDSKEK